MNTSERWSKELPVIVIDAGAKQKSVRSGWIPLVGIAFAAWGLASCGGSKGGNSGGGEPPSTEQVDTAEATERDVEIRFKDMPPGETSVWSSSSSIIGESSLSCSRNGYGLAVYKSNTFGDQIARVCCINLDVAALNEPNAKFTTRDGAKFTVKPEACDIATITGGASAPSSVVLDLSGQQLAAVDRVETFYSVRTLSIQGAKTRTQIVATNSSRVMVQGAVMANSLRFQKGGLSYTYTDAASSLELSNVTFSGAGLEIGDSLKAISGEHKTQFKNVKIYTGTEVTPLKLTNYPFDTTGIEIVAHKSVPSHVVFTGTVMSPRVTLKQDYPTVVEGVKLAGGVVLTVSPGMKLWSSLKESGTVDMFQPYPDSQLLVLGESNRRIRIEPFQRLDGGAMTFQNFISDSGYGKTSLTQVDIDSTRLAANARGILELDNVTGEMKPEAAVSSMVSKSLKVAGTHLVYVGGGTVKVLGPTALKRNGGNSFFAYSHCGRIEGLGNVTLDGASALAGSAVLVHEENDWQVVNQCSQFYTNDGKKQLINHPAISLATGANSFRPALSCRLSFYTTGSWSFNISADCYSVGAPNFSGVRVVSQDVDFWSGNLTENTQAVGGDTWTGPKFSDGKLILKGTDGVEFRHFPAKSAVNLVVPESEFYEAFVMPGTESAR